MLNDRDLTPLFGAEISTLDLSRGLDKAGVKALLHRLDARGVLIVRGQQFTAERFMAFSHSLGELSVHPQERFSMPEFPQLTIDSNIIDDGAAIGRTDSGRYWQTDGAHLKTPYRATLQYAIEIPARDGLPLGDTWFASTCAAYDALEPAQRQQLDGMRAVHVHGIARKKRATPYYADAALSQIFRRGVEHPVVRTHPHSGRKCLYVNAGSTSHIRGMNEHDSAALLATLYAHIARPAFSYRHSWQAGDLVIWDNCVTQYRTEADYELPQRRLLYRTQIAGSAVR